MKKKTLRRTLAVFAAAGLAALSVGLFAGCDTDHPEITITYTFNGKDYNVDYTLTREAAPQTVRHFLELVDAGYYDGMCVHDYDGVFMRAGGYYFDDNGELQQKDYFTAVKKIEETQGIKFTQSVFRTDENAANKKGEGLYTVYGEMENEQYTYTGSRYSHSKGALVMDYTSKGSYSGTVTTLRSGDGKYQSGSEYKYNSATSQFYTYLTSSGSSLDKNYCVFGMAKNYSEQMDNGLLKAIEDFIAEHKDSDENYEFTTEKVDKNPNRYDPFELVNTGNQEVTYHLPADVDGRITIKTIKVNKY